MDTAAERGTSSRDIGFRDQPSRFAWLSIAAALVTMGLKAVAWWRTGSVGLFADAVESQVDLSAGVLALIVLRIAERPPDEDHLAGPLDGAGPAPPISP